METPAALAISTIVNLSVGGSRCIGRHLAKSIA
jgi:hypothetical protein